MVKSIKKKIIIAVSLFAITIGAISAGITGRAIFQESDAVHIKANEIEESTLLIGTHLVYLGALDDRIYEIAQQSAQDSGQNKVYYKSELAEGAWYEISSAYSIADITAQGRPVTNQEIEELWLTHHTKSDGITYDLRSSEAVNTYDIYPVYELETMKELEPVKNQYELYKGENKKSNLVERNKKLIREMFRTKVTGKETEEYDLKLSALSAYLKILRDNNGSSDEIGAVEKIIDKTDDGRRVLVYQKVAAGLEKLSDGVSSDKDISSKEFQLDAELMDAISESQKNIENALIEKEGNMLKEGTMVMTREEYSLAGRLTTAALQQNYTICDEETAKLISLYHIMDGEIINKTEEIKLLDEALIPLAEGMYKEQLSAGESKAYREAVEKKSSHVVLEGILAEQEQGITAMRGELQFYIEARVDRLDSNEAQKYITEKQNSVGTFGSGIIKDSFQKTAEQSVEDYKKWLQNFLASLAKDQGNQELNNLYEEKEKLEAEKLDALDREKLTEAKQKEALLEAKEQEIQEKEDAISREVKELAEKKQGMEQEAAKKQEQGEEISGLEAGITSLENEIAVLLAGIPDYSGISSIQEQKENILKLLDKESLSEEDKAEILTGIEGLGTRIDINGSMAADALKEIYMSMASAKFLKETKEYDVFIEQIEEIIANHGNVLDQVLDTEEAAQILEEALGYQLSLAGNSGEGSDTDQEGAGGSGTDPGGTGGSGTDSGDAGGSGTDPGGTGGSGTDSGDAGGSGTDSGDAGGSGTNPGGAGGSGTDSGGAGESGTDQEDTGGENDRTALGNSGKEGGKNSNSKQAVAAVALALYGEQAQDSQLDNMLSGMAAAASKQENSYFFPIINKGSGSYYASVKSVAAYKGYRYVWNDSKKKAMLVSGGIYYGFSAFLQEVEREKEKKDTMSMEAGFQSTVFLPEDYIKKEFGCQVYPISDTGYGVLIDENMLKEAAEVSDILVNSSKK